MEFNSNTGKIELDISVGDYIWWDSYGIRKDGVVMQILHKGDMPEFSSLIGAKYRASSLQNINDPAPGNRLLVRSYQPNKNGTYIIYYPKIGDLHNCGIRKHR